MTYRSFRKTKTQETVFAPERDAMRGQRHVAFLKKTAVVSLLKSKRIFTPAYNIQEHADVSLLTVKNSLRAIKKLIKFSSGTNLIVSHCDENEKIWKNKHTRKKGVSYKTALPVLEKICRQTAEKYNIQIPFEEIYVMASPHIACTLTTCLTGLSKVFTVISEESPLTNAYDELYFKHGTIIRHLPIFNNSISEDSIIIRCSEDDLPSWKKIPVIDFSERIACSNLSVNPKNIYVNDENIAALAKLWGGKSGLELYELMGMVPGADAEVNINISADKIFLLDTDEF